MTSHSPTVNRQTKLRSWRRMATGILLAGLLSLIGAAGAVAAQNTAVTLTCANKSALNVDNPCQVWVKSIALEGAVTTPTGSVNFSSDSTGSFSATSCALTKLDGEEARCLATIYYRATAVGSGKHKVTAKYNGDPTHVFAFGSQTIDIVRSPTASVGCVPSARIVGQTTTCTVDLVDPASAPASPLGPVQFTSSQPGTFSGGGSCSPGTVSSGHTRCSVTYTPSAKGSGTHTIKARYAGEGVFSTAEAATNVEVEAVHPTAIVVTCSPDHPRTGKLSTCLAEVTDTATTPSALAGGEVEFSTSGGGVFAESRRCALSQADAARASCSVGYVPLDSGLQKLSAHYLGDVAHEQSQSEDFNLRVSNAGIRYAAPGGTGSQPCSNPADPCSLGDAASLDAPGTTIENGDEVVVLPGTYSGSAGDFSEFGRLRLLAGTYVHGEAGKPRPVLVFDTSGGVLILDGGGEIADLRLQGTQISSTPLFLSGGTVERVVSRGAGGVAIGCQASFGLIRDSACIGVGGNPRGIQGFGGSGEPSVLRLRNVTALAIGVGASGIEYRAGEGSDVKIDAKSVIAHAEGFEAKDIRAIGQGSGKLSVELSNSDYATVSASSATVTPAGEGTNITAPPLLKADNFHQQQGSPTIDGGALDQFSGATDVDGQDRIFDGDVAAEEKADIGADEAGHPTAQQLDCAPQEGQAGDTSICKFTIEDASPFNVRIPEGRVFFGSDSPGFFSGGGSCALPRVALLVGVPTSCTVEYTSKALASGEHAIRAEYIGDFRFDPAEAEATILVANPTATTLSCQPTGLKVGEKTTCTATVRDTNAHPAAPAGSVEFKSAPFNGKDQGFFLGAKKCVLAPVDLSTSSCSLTYVPTRVGTGTHDLTADYGGEAGHEISQGATSLNVAAESPERHPTVTAVACANGVAGQATTCTATVEDVFSGTATSPAGKVEFASPDGFFSGAGVCTLAPQGTAKALCQVSYTTLTSGSHEVVVSYGGDATHGLSQGTASLNVTQEPSEHDKTKTTLTCDPAALVLGESTTCTAVIRNETESTSPEGAVKFETAAPGHFGNGGTCQAIEDINGVVSCALVYTPDAIGGEHHKLFATYAGNADNTPSQGNAEVSVEAESAGPDNTTTELSCSAQLASGEAGDCTVTVVDTSAHPVTPSGEVSLTSDGAGQFKPAPNCTLAAIDGHEASCEAAYVPTKIGSGTHLLKAAYAGNPQTQASVGSASVNVINVAAIDLRCNPSTVPAEGSTNCTATVVDTSAEVRTPTGEVRLSVGSGDGVFSPAPVCILSESGAGEASCTLTYAPDRHSSGLQEIDAFYAGDALHLSASGSEQIAAEEDGRDKSTVAVSCEPASVAVGAPSTCSVSVSDGAAGASAPTGPVLFGHGNQGQFSGSGACLLQADTGTATSRCQLEYTPAAAGAHPIEAAYEGDEAHNPALATTNVDATGGPGEEGESHPTSTTLVCAPATTKVGSASTCTATVADLSPQGATTPAGKVSFESDNPGVFSAAASCTLAGSGTAASCQLTYTPSQLGSSTHRVSADYAGSDDHLASQGNHTLTVTTEGGGEEEEENPGEEGGDELRPTSTTLVCAPATTKVGVASTCTATVADLSPQGATTPAGKVSFESDNPGVFSAAASCTLAGSGTAASCQLTYTPSQLGSGTHELFATYEGSAEHRVSQGSHELTVTTEGGEEEEEENPGEEGGDELRPTSTTLACQPLTVEVGTTTTCVVSVQDLSPTPTAAGGSVKFASDAEGVFSAGAACNLVAGSGGEASCQLTYSPAIAGTHKVFATYQGDADHRLSQGSDSLLATDAGTEKHPTGTSLACTPSALKVNATTHCTVTVTDKAGDPTPVGGEVKFTAVTGPGSFLAASCQLAANGSCSVDYVPTAVGSGTHLLSAQYQGDAGHAGSTGEASLSVSAPNGEGKDATATAISCEPDPVIAGGGSACTVIVEDKVSGGSAPSGEVKVAQAGVGSFSNECKLADIGGGKARCQTVYTPADASTGSHLLLALFEGDAAHQVSSATLNLGVKPATGGHGSKTELKCDPATVVLGGAAVCSVTVTDTGANPTTPTGLATFATDSAGAFDSGGCALFEQRAGVARCQIVYTPAALGTHELSALYSGDPGHEPSALASEVEVVPAPEGAHATSAALTCDPAPAVAGTATSCTIAVADTTASPTAPGHLVIFASDSAGAFAPGGCELTAAANGKASCKVAYTPSIAGTHKLVAVYEGDATHLPARADLELTVGPAAGSAHVTETAVACAPQSIVIGGAPAATTCTATVKDTNAKPAAPAGKVSFATDGPGAFSVATCDLAASATGQSCQVTYTPSALGSGSHKVTATFAATATHLASAGATQVAVQQPPNTLVKKHPRKRTAQKVGLFTFVADQSPVSFQCKLDKLPWRACKSSFSTRTLKQKKVGKGKRKRVRFVYKLRSGPHVLQVRAINAQGLTDPTPAVFRWRVGPAKPVKKHVKK